MPTVHRDTAMKAAVWYPAGTPTYQATIGEGAIFVGTKAMVGAATTDGIFPLVVMSHGSGGNMDNMG